MNSYDNAESLLERSKLKLELDTLRPTVAMPNKSRIVTLTVTSDVVW